MYKRQVYFHGNKDNLKRWGKEVQPLLKFRYDVFVMDYRGYGKSIGKRTEKAMYDDALMFYEYVNQRFEENKILLYGRSLGSVFATYVAGTKQPSKLILETPFYSMESVVKSKIPFLPTSLILNFQFRTYQFTKTVESPTLVLLSEQDEVVPFENGRKLSQLFANSKRITIPKALHNNQAQIDEYWYELEQFLVH